MHKGIKYGEICFVINLQINMDSQKRKSGSWCIALEPYSLSGRCRGKKMLYSLRQKTNENMPGLKFNTINLL